MIFWERVFFSSTRAEREKFCLYFFNVTLNFVVIILPFFSVSEQANKELILNKTGPFVCLNLM